MLFGEVAKKLHYVAAAAAICGRQPWTFRLSELCTRRSNLAQMSAWPPCLGAAAVSQMFTSASGSGLRILDQSQFPTSQLQPRLISCINVQEKLILLQVKVL